MTQEDKELLLRDLCVRLPFGVKICCTDNPKINGHLVGIAGENVVMFSSGRADFPISDIRPYLRPMSSMTEEEKKEYESLCILIPVNYDSDLSKYDYYTTDSIDSFDWLNAHHFDYRNLIERGLVIDCTGLNVY